ncbi:MAG: flavin reductase family protein [Candidatus Bathyarchaeota archaeon]|jgi:flavin reductase (DIM6/NTAB) family NADH-FMN oxidoreductase RutF
MKIKKNPYTALFPCPVVLVTCVDSKGAPNIITLAWAGTVCSEPPTVGLGIRPSRHSHKLIENSREFVVNIPPAKILRETDYCGVTSGRDADKFSETKLTPEQADKVESPLIRECPVNMECKLKDVIPLGAHDLFLGEIVQIHINKDILDDKGHIDFKKANPFVFNVGEYWSLHKKIGTYGYSKRTK